MKNTILTLVFVFISAITTYSFANENSITGNSNTTFGEYTLEPSAEMVVINDVAYKTWKLTYSNTGENFVVFCSKDAQGKCVYTVRNSSFEIAYVKNGQNFGVQLVDQEMRTIKKRVIMDKINYDRYVSQLVLTTSEKNEKEYLGLVACFLPLLLG